MHQYDYDLFVIGAGSGGVRASRMAAQYGARVAIAENKQLGGTCVNVGCVPKKLFVYAAHYSDEISWAEGFGWTTSAPVFNWNILKNNKNAEISRLNAIYGQILASSNVDIIYGDARIVEAHKIVVDNKTYSCDKILIATGGKPFIPEFPGKELAISSDEVFHMDNFPRKVVVVGGGYIAVEFAGIFNGLGVETHLIYRGPLFLRGFDLDVRGFVAEELTKKGIHLHFNTEVLRIDKLNDGSLSIVLSDDTSLVVETALYATGRKPLTDNLGLETINVHLNKDQAISVNEHFQTSQANVYALGDVTDNIQLTPVAIAEAMAFSNHLYGDKTFNLDYQNIPTAVFCQPNIATVGLTEEQAQAQHPNIDIYKSSFSPMKHSLSGATEKTLMKVVVNQDNDQVLGMHMVGAEAGEIIQGMAVAMKLGLTKSALDSTIGIHPTAAEEFVTLRKPVPKSSD